MVDTDIQQAQQQLAEQQAQAQQLARTKIPVRRFGGSVTRAQQQAILEQRRLAKESLKEIAAQRKEVLDIQKQRDVLRAAQAAAQERQAKISRVIKRVSEGKNVGSEFKDLSKSDQRLITESIRTAEERGERAAIRGVEEQIGQTLPQESRAQVIEQLRAGAREITIPSIDRAERIQTLALPAQVLPDQAPAPSLVVRATPAPTTDIGAAERIISIQRAKGGIPATLAGFAAVPVGIAKFGGELLARPIQTTIGVGKGIGTGFEKAFITKEGFPEIGRILRQEPEFATGRIFGEVATLRVGQVAGLKVRPVVSRVVTPLRPGFRRIVGEPGARKVTVPFEGRELDIGFIERGGGFGIPLREQIEFAGRPDVITGTAQRGLFGPLRRAVRVEKPLPTPGAPALERALFVSPPGRRGVPEIRVSRLGLEPQRPATLLDILGGDITFRAPPRAQAIILRADVAAIPPRLRALARRAARAGAGSREAQQLAKRLERFQLTPTGELKPIGFPTGEAELVLAPGEILERRRRLGVTLIEGRPVEILEAGIRQVPRARPSTKAERLRREDISDITSKEISMETGIDFSSEALGKRGTISPSAALSFSLRAPSRKRITARRSAGLSPLSRVPTLRPTRPRRPSPRAAPRLGRVGRPSRAIRARPVARRAAALTTIRPPTLRPRPPLRIPRRKKDRLTLSGLKKASKDEDLFFVPSFSARLLNIRKPTTLKKLRKQVLRGDITEFRAIPDLTTKELKGGLR